MGPTNGGGFKNYLGHETFTNLEMAHCSAKNICFD
jgi:hypothetical protein